MEFESIERCWREEVDAPTPRLEEGSVLQMIEAQADALRGSLRRRLRREATYYLPIMAISVAPLASGFTTRRVLAAGAVAVLLGAVIATLWRAEHRMQEAPRDHSVRDALARLMSEIDSAARAYLAAYVLVFAVAALALAGFVWWRQGLGLSLAGAATGGLLAVFWSRRSGRSYVERMFRRQRAALADCLRQLEGEA